MALSVYFYAILGDTPITLRPRLPLTEPSLTACATAHGRTRTSGYWGLISCD